MDFADLFSKLSSTEEGSRRPGPPAFTTRHWRGCRIRGGRQSFQPERGHPNKKLKNDFGNHQGHEYRTSEGPKRGQTNRGRGWRGNNFNSHMGQQSHQPKTANGPKRGQKNWGRGQRGNSFSAPARPRFMTQEFKDQNALVVDGQIYCKHFIWGNCIKGDDCQMLHGPVHNGLIKEMCKFYVVGFCSRGDSCPYMHSFNMYGSVFLGIQYELKCGQTDRLLKSADGFDRMLYVCYKLQSFPCKFFHRKGLCVNGENCKFSHDPLTSVTEPLLVAAMKMEQESRERLMKVDQKQPTDVESTSVEEQEEKKPLDVLNPAMPKFYNSLEAHSVVDQAEEPAEVTEEDNIAPHSGGSPAKASRPVEPVCYSVEAVLGPRHSVPALFSYSASHVPPSLPAAPAPTTHPSETSLSEAPYSVAAVLRTYNKSLGSFSNPPSSSPDANVCVPATSPATDVNSELSPVDQASKAHFLQPLLRSQSKKCHAPVTLKPHESCSPGAKVKTVVDASRHNYPAQHHQSPPGSVTRLGDGPCGRLQSLFPSPPGQRAAPTKPPSSQEGPQDSPSSPPSQRGAQFKDCVTFLVRNLKTIESACPQPDLQKPETAKRKREGAGMAGRCGEFQFKSLFSAALPGASSNTPAPADGRDGGEVVAGVGALCALVETPLSQTTAPRAHPPTASPNSRHLRSSEAKETQQAAGTHSGRAVETSAAKRVQQLPTQLDAEARSHQQLQSNKCSPLKSLFLSLSPSSAFQ